MGRLSKGGMAEIFLAKRTDPKHSGKLLVIKRTLPEYGGDREFLSMFLDEAYISTSLVHPNICRVSDTGQNGKELYLVMEFIHGKDLRMIVKRLNKLGRELPPIFAAFILTKIARALYYAHTKCDPIDGKAQNIVHRDVNPQNILVSYAGVPTLIDFGIAKAKDRVSKTRAGVLKGKFSYLSPEQVLGQPIDGRSDVFALGVVLYSLLVGARPFEARGEPALLLKISEGKYPPAHQLKPEIDPDLEAIVDKALKKDLSQRYASAAEMADDLDAFLEKFPAANDEDLGAFVREIFSEQYEREIDQINGYEAESLKPALDDTLDDTLDSPDREDEFEQTVAILQEDGATTGLVGMATVLAAGYDIENSANITLTEPSTPPPAEIPMEPDFDREVTHMLPDMALSNSDAFTGNVAREVSKTGPNLVDSFAGPTGESAAIPAMDWDADATLALSGSQVEKLSPGLAGGQSQPPVGSMDDTLDPEETLRQPTPDMMPYMNSIRRSGILSGTEIGILLVAAVLGLGIVYWVYSTKVVHPDPSASEKTKVTEVRPANNPPVDPN